MGDSSRKNLPDSDSVFGIAERIRLGVWGLGRGLAVARAGRAVNIEVVAGCDTDERLRAAFAAELPEAVCTADADEFLASGIDAVLIATYCPAHAGHAIAALRRGLDVLSEVTAFFTCAERLADPSCRAALTAERDSFARRLPAWEERPGESLPQLAMRRIGFASLPALAFPGGYTLRTGRGEADAPAWCGIIGESFGQPFSVEDYRRQILAWDGYASDRLFFVVDPDGVECATAGAFGSNDVGYVHYVGTLPSHTGRGLGLQATLAALHSFRERGLPACRLTTDDHRHAALKTYHRLGFEPEITNRSHRVRWQRLAELLRIEAFRV